jgi:phosphoribosylamine--glycine ligase
MNILVIGSGGREHALAWKLRQSPLVDVLFVAPGNGGTAQIATNLPISATDVEVLARAARAHRVDLTVVGPEAPLALGIADRFRQEGLAIVGPTKAAAQIEASKLFAKRLMLRHGIPTAGARAFSSHDEARSYVDSAPLPLVIKADGLAAGKGVAVCHRREEGLKALHDCMVARVFGPAGDRVLVEEFLTGQEVSVFAFSDGAHVSPLVAACDYKRALDGDQGPNTGGMGSYSPPTFWTEELSQVVMERIMRPVIGALAAESAPFRGVIYGGLMLTAEGPKVLEFNSRLGDPEAQVILPRLSSDLVELLLAVANGTLDQCPIHWSPQACVGVVAASGGYPGEYRTGHLIQGLERLEADVLVFHAGTQTRVDGITGRPALVTAGGRVLTVAALGSTLEEARTRVYTGLRRVQFQDMDYRRDIALGVGAPV